MFILYINTMNCKQFLVDVRPNCRFSTTLQEYTSKQIDRKVLNTSGPKGLGTRSLGTFAFNVYKHQNMNVINLKFRGDLITIINDDEIRFNLYEDCGKIYFSPIKPGESSQRIGRNLSLNGNKRHKRDTYPLSNNTLSAISVVRYFSVLSILSYTMPVKLKIRELIELISLAGRKTIKSLKGLFNSAQALTLGMFSSIGEYHRSNQKIGYTFFKRDHRLVLPRNLLPFKGFISQCLKDEDYVQHIPSIFRCAEVITGPLDRSGKTILDPYNGTLIGESLIEFTNEFTEEANIFLKKYIKSSRIRELVSQANVFRGYISGKSCPSGQGATKSFKSEFLSLRNYKDQESYYKILNHYLYGQTTENIINYIDILFNLELEFNFNIGFVNYSKQQFICDLLHKSLPEFKFNLGFKDGHLDNIEYSTRPIYHKQVYNRAGECFKHVPYVGDLLFLDKPFGGTRTVARGNTFFQAALSGGERVLSNILRFIYQDFTHKQDLLGLHISEHLGDYGQMPFSSDATAWTDRLPSFLNEIIFKIIFGERLGCSFYSILKDCEYCINGADVKKGLNPEFITYQVGQGMGLLTSWASSAVVHHVLARLALKRAGFKYYKRSAYAVLGDDIIIHGKAFNAYRDIVSSLGLELSLSKCTSSPFYCEIAKRLFRLKHNSLNETSIVEVTGYPSSELYRLFDSPIDRCIELFNRLDSRDIDIFYPFNGICFYLFNSKYGGSQTIFTLSKNINSEYFANLIGVAIAVTRISSNKRFRLGDCNIARLLYAEKRLNLFTLYELYINNASHLVLSSYSRIIPFIELIRFDQISGEQNPFLAYAYRDKLFNIFVDLRRIYEELVDEDNLIVFHIMMGDYFLKVFSTTYCHILPEELLYNGAGLNPGHYDNFLGNNLLFSDPVTNLHRIGMYSAFKVVILIHRCLDCFKQVNILSKMVDLAISVKDLDGRSNQKIRYKCILADRLELIKLILSGVAPGPQIEGPSSSYEVLKVLIMSTLCYVKPVKHID